MEKSWNLKMFISRPEEVIGKENAKSFGKVMEMLFYSHVYRSVYIVYAFEFSLV